jgi:hypothetical protein
VFGSRSRASVVGIVALACVGAAVLAWSTTGERTNVVDDVDAADDAARLVDAIPDERVSIPRVIDVVDPDATTPRPTHEEFRPEHRRIRLRLRGLHASAPWTEPLLVVLADPIRDGRSTEFRGTIDAVGRCEFEWPAWVDASRPIDLRVTATNAHYRALNHHDRGRLDVAAEIVVDVQVVATLEGRVVDTRQQPVEFVRVVAFATQSGRARHAKLAEVDTASDGTFRIVVPPDLPLLLVAAPMRPMRTVRGARGGRGPVADSGELDDALLPATRVVHGVAGVVTDVGAITLTAAARVTGVVLDSGGRPVPLATVQSDDADLEPLRIAPRVGVAVVHGDLVLPRTGVDTGDDGTFTLPGVDGVAFDVVVTQLLEAKLLGDGPRVRVVAPGHVTLRLPSPTRIECVAGGRPTRGAVLEVDDGKPMSTDGGGALDVVCDAPRRVRAVRDGARSEWVTIGPGTAGTTIRLALDVPLGEVRFVFAAEHVVRNANVHWRCDDGREGRQLVAQQGEGGSLRLWLEPGRYRLRLTSGVGSEHSIYLLPSEHVVDVAASTTHEVRPVATFGGIVAIAATDARGLRIDGACPTLDAAATVLPPGEHELRIDFGPHGVHTRRVTVRAFEWTELRFRF